MNQLEIEKVEAVVAMLTKQIDAYLDSDLFDQDMYTMYCEDRSDYIGIANLLRKGKTSTAVLDWSNLDTAARNYYTVLFTFA